MKTVDVEILLRVPGTVDEIMSDERLDALFENGWDDALASYCGSERPGILMLSVPLPAESWDAVARDRVATLQEVMPDVELEDVRLEPLDA
jgi:hypothetical protein